MHRTRILLLSGSLSIAGACRDESTVLEAIGPSDASPAITADASVGDASGDATTSSLLDASDRDATVSAPVVDCSPYTQPSGCILHATPDANSTTTGLSWDQPLALQAALDLSVCGCEVWLAAGTYLPTRQFEVDDIRTRSFQLWPDARVLGGFAGDETSATERDPELHPTILSGDLGEPLVREDNAYHVVVGADGAELDGLTIRDGQADGFLDGQIVGAGLFNLHASMTLRHVNITDNNAGSGGGIYNDGSSSPQLFDCYLARNVADTGGGLYVGGVSNSHIERCVFDENVAIFDGGGIAHGAGVMEVLDSRFIGNRGDSGGAIILSGSTGRIERSWFEANWAGLFGGAMLVRSGASASLVSSVVFANTSVGHGGGFMIWVTSTLQLSGVTVANNSAAFGGAMLVKDESQATTTDSLIWGNTDNAGEIYRLEGLDNVLIIEDSLAQSSSTNALASDAGNLDGDPLLLNVPTLTRFTEREGTLSELRVDNSPDFAIGDRVELDDDGIERTISALGDHLVSFTPPLATNTARFLRIDLWPPSATSLALDLHLAPSSPAIDRASSVAPALDVYGQARVDLPGIGTDCADSGCSAGDLGGVETLP